MGNKLNWSDYKMEPRERSVWFGGMTLYVLRRERGDHTDRRRAAQWRVTWYEETNEVPRSEVPGLTDQWFGSLQAAQRAAERYFVPFLKLIPKIVSVETIVTVHRDALPAVQTTVAVCRTALKEKQK